MNSSETLLNPEVHVPDMEFLGHDTNSGELVHVPEFGLPRRYGIKTGKMLKLCSPKSSNCLGMDMGV
jgi:hypothetical protein